MEKIIDKKKELEDSARRMLKSALACRGLYLSVNIKRLSRILIDYLSPEVPK